MGLPSNPIPKQPMPSAKPSPPFKPPRTTTTYGTDNTIPDNGHEGNNQPGVPYGAHHRPLTIVSKSERASDFSDGK